jgi:hypothetical protein
VTQIELIIRTAIRNRCDKVPELYRDINGAVAFIRKRVPKMANDRSNKEEVIEKLGNALNDWERQSQ